jgi:glycosyltransferase involved in cell wall biosynthesis/2-polyprenyl-3-methyl-5-hydroxy-6-metoxy-1,4-benzoquinol methylase
LHILFLGTNYGLQQANDVLEYHVKHWPPTGGLDVILRTARVPGLVPTVLPNGSDHGIHFHPTCSTSRAAGFRDLLAAAAAVARSRPVDLTVCDDPFSSAIAGFLIRRRFGIPMCVQYMGDIVDNPLWLRDRFRNRLVYPYATWLLRRADSVRVISAANKAKLVQRMGIPGDRIFVVPNIKGVERFVAADGTRVRARYAAGGFAKVVLYVGRLESQKDVGTLLRAVPPVVERHPETLFLIGGNGSEEESLRRLCRELRVEGNVVFTGFIQPGEVPEYFRACDVFVLPSLWEDRAGVLVEALAAGRPAVATDTQGTAEVIQDGTTGFIVKPRRPDQIAERLLRLLGNEELAARMGAAGQRFIQAHLDEQAMRTRMLEMWRYTAGRHAGGRRSPRRGRREAPPAGPRAQGFEEEGGMGLEEVRRGDGVPHAPAPGMSARADAVAAWERALRLDGQVSLRASVLRELQDYFGMSAPEVEARLQGSRQQFVQEWYDGKVNPRAESQVVHFYNSTSSEIFELMHWHSTHPEEGGANYVCALRLAQRMGARRCLDYGSGVGAGAILLAAHGLEVTLADIATPLLEFAAWRLSRRALPGACIDLKAASLPEGRYDLVTCLDTLEHVPNPREIIKSIRRSLRPGGILIVHAPGGRSEKYPEHLVHDPMLVAKLRSLGFRYRSDLVTALGDARWGDLRVLEKADLGACRVAGYRVAEMCAPAWALATLGVLRRRLAGPGNAG